MDLELLGPSGEGHKELLVDEVVAAERDEHQPSAGSPGSSAAAVRS